MDVALISSAPLGMARDVYQSAVYVSHGDVGRGGNNDSVLSWAPEVLEDDSFSSKSDVWAFGVCVVGRTQLVIDQ